MSRPIVAIEGIMGAGKTTLCGELARYLDALICPEDAESPEFQEALQRYYDKPTVHAAEFQVFVLERRALRLQWAVHQARRGERGQVVLQDRCLLGDRAIATTHRDCGNIDLWSWRLYEALYYRALAHTPPPSIVLYLDIDPRDALSRVASRARMPELEGVTLDYLQRQRDAYEAAIRLLLRGHPWSNVTVLRVPAAPSVCGLGIAWHLWSALTSVGYGLRPFAETRKRDVTPIPILEPFTSICLPVERASAG